MNESTTIGSEKKEVLPSPAPPAEDLKKEAVPSPAPPAEPVEVVKAETKLVEPATEVVKAEAKPEPAKAPFPGRTFEVFGEPCMPDAGSQLVTQFPVPVVLRGLVVAPGFELVRIHLGGAVFQSVEEIAGRTVSPETYLVPVVKNVSAGPAIPKGCWFVEGDLPEGSGASPQNPSSPLAPALAPAPVPVLSPSPMAMARKNGSKVTREECLKVLGALNAGKVEGCEMELAVLFSREDCRRLVEVVAQNYPIHEHEKPNLLRRLQAAIQAVGK